MTYGSVTVSSTATLILAGNMYRHSVIMVNGGVDRVHFGPDASITTACPYIIPDGSFVEGTEGATVYKGDFYGITTGGTAKIYYWERTH